jgi:hypothetical protein
MGPQWDRSRRWTREHVIYVSLLMVLEDAMHEALGELLFEQ